MIQIPAGMFVMGSDLHYAEEWPAHVEQLAGFWIDEHPVTNVEFRRFVKATGHLTTAELQPEAGEFPDALPEELVPGSLVFHQTPGPVPLDDWRRWWRWTPGAHWRAPSGVGSNLGGKELHPVVHVSFEDALAYAAWAGKELASEVEWEYAARAGGGHTAYAWGEEYMPGGTQMANTWHGQFPWQNDEPPGRDRTTRVDRFPPNNWGLRDMIGNVWEWTASTWTDDHRGDGSGHDSCCAPEARLSEGDRRVMKGGSHLCAPSYCLRYRPAARQGQEVRSSTSHLGFRCVMRA